MKIVNRTHYVTSDLRAIVSRVAREELDAAQRMLLRVEVRYSRKRSCSGFAYRNGRDTTLRLNKHVVDPVQFAWLTAHELAHIRGMKHRAMPRSLHWFTDASKTQWGWAATMPLRVAGPKRCERPTLDARLVHAQLMLAKATTRLRRATTIRQRWVRRIRDLERRQRQILQLAAGAGDAS